EHVALALVRVVERDRGVFRAVEQLRDPRLDDVRGSAHQPHRVPPGVGPWHPTPAVIVERSMDPSWLSNAYLVADRRGGTGLFVDSGAPLDPLIAAVEELDLHVPFLLTTHGHGDHIAHHDELEESFGLTVLADPAEGVTGAEPLSPGTVVDVGDLKVETLRPARR